MRKVSEIFKNTPVIGSYIRFEKRLLKQLADGWDKFQNRPSLSARIGNAFYRLPLVGPVLRFPGALAAWLEDLPIIGPLAFRPAFALLSFAKTTFIDKPARLAARFIAYPLLTAGAVTLALQTSPDTVSQTFNDYAKDRSIDGTLLDGVKHSNIRIYTGGSMGTIFHAAGLQVSLTREAMEENQKNTFTGNVAALASYPVHLYAMAGAVSDGRNAFAIPPAGDDAPCFIRMMDDSISAPAMLAVLAGLDEDVLNVDKASLARWLPQMVLGHEARHCDNSKDTLAVRNELVEMTLALEKQKIELLSGLMDEGLGMEEALRALEKDSTYKEAQRTLLVKESELDRITLQGETDSDIYVSAVLERQFPGEKITEIARHARAISPFVNSMHQSNSHATASGLENALRQIDRSSAFEVWDAINVAKALVRVGIIMGDTDRPLIGFETTALNYLVAKDTVIPWLQARADQSVPRGDRQVRYALILEQLQMFVDGIDALVKPEALAEATAVLNVPPVTLPDFAAPSTPISSPAPKLAP